MFKKPVSQLKNFSPLRSSDRRRFQNEAYDAYPHIKEKLQEGPALMPDPLLMAKFSSHVNTQGFVYVANNKPLWLKLGGLPPVPTVYTMWEHPDILPKLYTWGPVVHKLMDGADLMIPGLVPGPDGTLPDLPKDALVAITIKGYPYPLAIGTMALPTKDIRPRSGMKGKAVHIIHVYHDHLWAMGDKSEPPELETISDDEYEEEEGEDEEDGRDDASKMKAPSASAPPANEEADKEVLEEEEKPPLSAQDTDSILQQALLQGLLFKMTPDGSQAQLPMSASNFFSSIVLPSRPRGFGSDADLKRSSWKKLNKFLKTMEKQKILKTKDQRGELVVTSVNWTYPGFEGLSAYKTIETQKPNTVKSDASKMAAAPTASQNSSEPAQIQDMYKPLGTGVVALFEAAKQDKDKMYNATEVRQMITEFVKTNGLANPRNQKMVKIDAVLCDAILNKSEYHSVNELGRDQIVQRLLDKMQRFHVLVWPGKEPVLRKGSPKPITITQEVRQGRKTITKVTGMEHFDLSVDGLCKELTKLCASSATHNPIHGTSPKQPLHEIMVQGPQIKLVNQLLLNKGIPKKLIVADDKTGKKKKGGK
ncbi:hypothetical protein BCR43DRAFT_493418 [Syncephalastrum racemosum]|uniref:SUI1 domain-containing protein n=1 Tax=Syncephalastrum racemosum TaxID=13706 RepID=A0A1X2HAK9_SYNRA|nr:hypothetical protein BCR43DRAFT_493418 [Syncephalastrum racemosum]